MKREDISDALSYLDDEHIECAMELRQSKKRPRRWVYYAAAAACLVLAALAVFRFAPLKETPEEPTVRLDLPMISSAYESDGMGYEGLSFRDISESSSANPWTENARLETLPVFKNPDYVAPGSRKDAEITESDNEAQRKLTADAAEKLGLTILDPGYYVDDTGFYVSYTQTDKARISTWGKNSLMAHYLKNPQPIAEGLSFTYGSTDQKQATETIEYLLERYKDFCGMEDPVIDTWGEYLYTGEMNRRYQVYENSDDLVQKILNYNLVRVSFSPGEEGGALEFISRNDRLTGAEKLGDYPIITAADAKKLLLDGCFITTVPLDYLKTGKIRSRDIAKVELIYRSSYNDEYLQPYYRFYIELSEDSRAAIEVDWLKNYGVFYVPAVRSEYLSDFDQWDGSFN